MCLVPLTFPPLEHYRLEFLQCQTDFALCDNGLNHVFVLQGFPVAKPNTLFFIQELFSILLGLAFCNVVSQLC